MIPNLILIGLIVALITCCVIGLYLALCLSLANAFDESRGDVSNSFHAEGLDHERR